MTDLAAEQEASEAAADALEQAWLHDQAAATLADSLPEGSPELGRTPDTQQAWSIGGDSEAQWAIDRYSEAAEEVARIRRNAQAQIEAIQAKALRDEQAAAHSQRFFEGKLIDYYRRLEAQNPRLPKTYKLANGDLTVRAGRRSVKVLDETAFVAWAIDNAPDALSHKPKVSALKDMDRADDGHLVDPATGEILPGVVEVVGEPTYSVKPAAPEPEPF